MLLRHQVWTAVREQTRRDGPERGDTGTECRVDPTPQRIVQHHSLKAVVQQGFRLLNGVVHKPAQAKSKERQNRQTL